MLENDTRVTETPVPPGDLTRCPGPSSDLGPGRRADGAAPTVLLAALLALGLLTAYAPADLAGPLSRILPAEQQLAARVTPSLPWLPAPAARSGAAAGARP
ncbi:hypothetical protein [Kitasatospora aureofaciens]|uniref:hypothetical protein n=1 Tax=Kitasatospora aureofaciens TaxID=1894 RepID=UPI001C43E0BA|nr:hypothetical protein [Kitasatospora aureofaciens]MBV6700446.1 hypothetical protein [Kitasatospora aureofaciens]